MPATIGGFGTSTAHKQCTAMSKRSGSQCRGPAIAGDPNQKCRMHGGSSQAIGTNHANFKDGRHSRYLPARLDELYREARSNPELLEMADHIALLEAHMQEVLGASTEGDPVPQWKEIAAIFADVETAILGGDIEATIKQLEAFHRLLDAGMAWDRTWTQVQGIMEQLRKLTDTEVKRKKELNQMVPIERIVILMAAVGSAVKRHVTNPDEIRLVHQELATLICSDKVPERGNQVRVGPEIIDISPESRGSKGGTTDKARYNKRVKQAKELAASMAAGSDIDGDREGTDGTIV